MGKRSRLILTILVVMLILSMVFALVACVDPPSEEDNTPDGDTDLPDDDEDKEEPEIVPELKYDSTFNDLTGVFYPEGDILYNGPVTAKANVSAVNANIRYTVSIASITVIYESTSITEKITNAAEINDLMSVEADILEVNAGQTRTVTFSFIMSANADEKYEGATFCIEIKLTGRAVA